MQYPYHVDQYAKDVRYFALATEVPEHRQGQMFIFVLGGAARRFFVDLTVHEEQYGVELGDGIGGLVRLPSV